MTWFCLQLLKRLAISHYGLRHRNVLPLLGTFEINSLDGFFFVYPFPPRWALPYLESRPNELFRLVSFTFRILYTSLLTFNARCWELLEAWNIFIPELLP